jgi:hypothetical protein
MLRILPTKEIKVFPPISHFILVAPGASGQICGKEYFSMIVTFCVGGRWTTKYREIRPSKAIQTLPRAATALKSTSWPEKVPEGQKVGAQRAT